MQLAGCSKVHRDTKFVFKRELQVNDVKETCPGGEIDEEVQIARLGVVAMQRGAEEAWVAHAVFSDEAADGLAMLLEDGRGLHAEIVDRGPG